MSCRNASSDWVGSKPDRVLSNGPLLYNRVVAHVKFREDIK